MNSFLEKWAEAAYTSTGFFWMALWAFILGYAISSIIQVFVTKEKMQKAMGKDDARSVGLATFFGFISSSCSFSALATTKSLFQKGAGFVSSIAFLLSSTNLVIELGIVISIFLGWQFVVGEYVGGLLLIGISWLLIRFMKPVKLIKKAREKLGDAEHSYADGKGFWQKLKSRESWNRVGMQYGMEWHMVWKDVTIGFTVAGLVSAFVPDSFFETLFINTGNNASADFSFLTLLEHAVVGPVAAFLTFIGSMGNIPLAALLYGKGVSFAGVMAFIFSDLVVFPVLRINAKYYGWKMSLFMLFLLFTSLVSASLLLHYGFQFLEVLPQLSSGQNITEQKHFKLDYTFWLNLLFIGLSGVLVYVGYFRKSAKKQEHHHEMAPKSAWFEKVLKYVALACYAWLLIGLMLKFI